MSFSVLSEGMSRVAAVPLAARAALPPPSTIPAWRQLRPGSHGDAWAGPLGGAAGGGGGGEAREGGGALHSTGHRWGSYTSLCDSLLISMIGHNASFINAGGGETRLYCPNRAQPRLEVVLRAGVEASAVLLCRPGDPDSLASLPAVSLAGITAMEIRNCSRVGKHFVSQVKIFIDFKKN